MKYFHRPDVNAAPTHLLFWTAHELLLGYMTSVLNTWLTLTCFMFWHDEILNISCDICYKTGSNSFSPLSISEPLFSDGFRRISIFWVWSHSCRDAGWHELPCAILRMWRTTWWRNSFYLQVSRQISPTIAPADTHTLLSFAQFCRTHFLTVTSST